MNRTLLGRILVLLVVSLVGASLLVDWRRVPQDALEAGDVAPRTVKAPVTFTFQDFESFQRQRAEAESAVLPVFVHQVELADDVLIQLRTAFANARALASSSAQDAFQGKQRREFQNAVVAQLERDLRIQLVEADVLALLSEGFAPSYEAWCAELVGDAMAQIIVADRSALRDATAIRVLTLGEDREERVVRELDQVSTLPEIRQQIALKTLNSDFGATSAGKAASTIARSMVRANLTYSPIETLDREKRAAQEVRLTPDVIKRGTSSIGIRPCGGCQRRAAALNRWVVFTGRSR